MNVIRNNYDCIQNLHEEGVNDRLMDHLNQHMLFKAFTRQDSSRNYEYPLVNN